MSPVFISPLHSETLQDTPLRSRGGKEGGGLELALTRQRTQVPGATPSEAKGGPQGWVTVLLAFPHEGFTATGDPEPAAYLSYLSP